MPELISKRGVGINVLIRLSSLITHCDDNGLLPLFPHSHSHTQTAHISAFLVRQRRRVGHVCPEGAGRLAHAHFKTQGAISIRAITM